MVVGVACGGGVTVGADSSHPCPRPRQRHCCHNHRCRGGRWLATAWVSLSLHLLPRPLSSWEQTARVTITVAPRSRRLHDWGRTLTVVECPGGGIIVGIVGGVTYGVPLSTRGVVMVGVMRSQVIVVLGPMQLVAGIVIGMARSCMSSPWLGVHNVQGLHWRSATQQRH